VSYVSELIHIHTLKKETYPLWIDFSGKTEASKKVELTSRVNGELQRIFFKAGDEVKKGQPLFKIDDSQYSTILEQKEANLEKNRASLALAMANVKRYTPLINKGLAPKEKLDELKAIQKQMQATVNADFASIKQARLDVDYTTIKSTIDGKVGKTLVDIGNLVSASNTVLAHIINAKTLFVNFSPSANEVSLIKKYKSETNPRVIIKPENSGKSLELNGNIDFIDNTSNESTGTVAMRAKIDNKNSLLFPGTFVEIKLFLTDKLEFIAVPTNAIFQNQLGSYVFVVDTQNKIQTRQIKITYSNKDFIIVKEGLNSGDKIVLSATNRLKNNQIVEPIEIKNPIKR
jgi:RND family efflux transporter MFP subunit